MYIFYKGGSRFLSGLLKHPFRNIYSDYRFCALLGSITTMPTKTTSKIKNTFSRKIWHHFLELMPFPSCFKSSSRPRHLLIIIKKFYIIIFIFFHFNSSKNQRYLYYLSIIISTSSMKAHTISIEPRTTLT